MRSFVLGIVIATALAGCATETAAEPEPVETPVVAARAAAVVAPRATDGSSKDPVYFDVGTESLRGVLVEANAP